MAATTEPFAFVLRRDDVTPEMARFVVVAWEVVAFTAVTFWRVVEPVKVLLVYVFGMVVEAAMYAFTSASL
jgi:hypothetical protein